MCRASALFVGVYEPTKQKLLKLFPENLSAAAHLVRDSSISYYHEKDILVWLGHMINEHLLNLLFTMTSPRPCKSGSFVQWICPFKTCRNTKIVTHEDVSIPC